MGAEFSSLSLEKKLSGNWVWIGGVTDTSARFRARPGRRTSYFVVSENADLSDPVYGEALEVSDEDGGLVSGEFSSLSPGTQMYYALLSEEGGERIESGGKFRTFPASGEVAPIRIGMASCARSQSNSGAFTELADADLDLFVHMGDLHYENIDVNKPSEFDDAYVEVFKAARYNRLLTNQAIMYTFDDHDFGNNNADSTSPSKPAALAAYRKHVPHYDLAEGDVTEVGIYQSAEIGGTVLVIMPDLVSEKTKDERFMSDAQEEWIYSELLRGRDDFEVILFVSSKPWIGSSPTGEGGDSWLGNKDIRARISTFLADNNISNLVMVAGDTHEIALDDGTNTDYSGGSAGGFPILHAAPMDQYGLYNGGGPFTHGCQAYAAHRNEQYGIVRITEGPCVRMEAHKVGEGSPAILYEACAPFRPADGGQQGGGDGSCDIEIMPVWAWFLWSIFALLLLANVVMCCIASCRGSGRKHWRNKGKHAASCCSKSDEAKERYTNPGGVQTAVDPNDTRQTSSRGPSKIFAGDSGKMRPCLSASGCGLFFITLAAVVTLIGIGVMMWLMFDGTTVYAHESGLVLGSWLLFVDIIVICRVAMVRRRRGTARVT